MSNINLQKYSRGCHPTSKDTSRPTKPRVWVETSTTRVTESNPQLPGYIIEVSSGDSNLGTIWSGPAWLYFCWGLLFTSNRKATVLTTRWQPVSTPTQTLPVSWRKSTRPTLLISLNIACYLKSVNCQPDNPVDNPLLHVYPPDTVDQLQRRRETTQLIVTEVHKTELKTF